MYEGNYVRKKWKTEYFSYTHFVCTTKFGSGEIYFCVFVSASINANQMKKLSSATIGKAEKKSKCLESHTTACTTVSASLIHIEDI